jgi:putative ABC transport system substrate-binding protein
MNQMKRRKATRLLAASALPLPFAKVSIATTRPLRVGAVGLSRSSPHWQVFIRDMADRGYVEGDNFIFDLVEVTDGFYDYDVRSAYRTLAARKADLFLAIGAERSLRAAQEASPTIPIIIVAIDYDPVAHGYVKDLAKPGGRITGAYFQQIELTAKRLQILKDAFPDMRSVTVFWGSPSVDQWNAAQKAAPSLDLELVGVQFNEQPHKYDDAFVRIAPAHRQHLLVTSTGSFFADRERLARFTLASRTRSMFTGREWVSPGGLASYGPNLADMFRRLAEFVARIARGMSPSELPIEQPVAFELAINLRTARALGIAIPASILARTNEVFE